MSEKESTMKGMLALLVIVIATLTAVNAQPASASTSVTLAHYTGHGATDSPRHYSSVLSTINPWHIDWSFSCSITGQQALFNLAVTHGAVEHVGDPTYAGVQKFGHSASGTLTLAQAGSNYFDWGLAASTCTYSVKAYEVISGGV